MIEEKGVRISTLIFVSMVRSTLKTRLSEDSIRELEVRLTDLSFESCKNRSLFRHVSDDSIFHEAVVDVPLFIHWYCCGVAIGVE